MPSNNTIKDDVPDTYYHVYSRGVNKQKIFLDDADFMYFQRLFERYLSKEDRIGKDGRPYPNHSESFELLAFCLMDNHFHLLIYQHGEGSMVGFMRSLLTSYSKYFNLKYDRRGPLFESRYKASRITNQSYLQHISRYIHLNPRYWLRYPHSSIRYYVYGDRADWLQPSRVKSMFTDSADYLQFLREYQSQKTMLAEIKHALANY